MLQLVSLQKAAGFWELNASLAAVFGKTEDQVTNQKAAQVGHMMSSSDRLMIGPVRVFDVCLFQVDVSVWATVLALIWLYAFKSDQQDEWQFVAMKAASWIRSQKREMIFSG